MLELLRRFKDIFEHLELLFRLASKEIKVRYKHPFLGFLWALLLPMCMVFIFKIIFSVILKVTFEGYPFFVFLVSGIFPWNFFSLSLSTTTMSLLENSDLIKKVYFPRELIPISIVFANLINFIFTLIVVFFILFLFKIKIGYLVLLLPLVVFIQTIFIIGIVLIFSILQVYYRDIKYIVEVLIIGLFYLTPIFYPLKLVSNISNTFLSIYMLNPLVQIITLYRLVLFGDYINYLPNGVSIFNLFFNSLILSFFIFFIGLWVFKKYEPRLADYT